MARLFLSPTENPKIVCVEGESDWTRHLFCGCYNTCMKGTGAKRAGCPCRDQGLSCTNQCTCGTPSSSCNNKAAVPITNTSVKTKQDDISQAANTAVQSKGNVTERAECGGLVMMNSYHTDSDKRHDVSDGDITKLASVLDNVNIDDGSRAINTKYSTRASKFNARGSSNVKVHKITKGYALIIQNKSFKNLVSRDGSEKDMEAIKAFCERAGITVNTSSSKTEDLTATEIEKLCDEISHENFDRYDAFLCIILSHGKEEAICGVDGNTVSVQTIVSSFRNVPTLTDKPKLFFIQACRGSRQDFGVEADSVCEVRETSKVRLPTNSDFLIAYSTVCGYESYRFREHGTLFIQTLMEQLNQHAHQMHLMDIMTLVNQQIAEFEFADGRRKQMSCQTSTLTKLVYFNVR